MYKYSAISLEAISNHFIDEKLHVKDINKVHIYNLHNRENHYSMIVPPLAALIFLQTVL
jgi:hypothetical protein